MAKKVNQIFDVSTLLISVVSVGEMFRNSSQDLLVSVFRSLATVKVKNAERETQDYIDAVEWMQNVATKSNLNTTEDRNVICRNLVNALAEETAASVKANRQHHVAILSKRNPKMIARSVNKLILELHTNVIYFEEMFKNIGKYIENDSPFANADLQILNESNKENLPTSSSQYESAYATLTLFTSFSILRKKFESLNRHDLKTTKGYIVSLLQNDKFKSKDSTPSCSYYSITLPHPVIDNPKRRYTSGDLVINLNVETVEPSAEKYQKITVRGSVKAD